MKMQRYHARDMRQALARIRAEQGPDAVILSTERTASGVVVCAAVDFDFSEPPPAPTLAAGTAAGTDDGVPDAVTDVLAGTSLLPDAEPAESSATDAMRREIRGLRHLLEAQLAALAWNDYTRRQPMQARVLEELTRLGLARDLALALVRELPDGLDADQAGRLPLAHLARRIPTAASAALERGGTLALVGPNGAGKTTTLAKFATRWVLQHGAGALALVSTDRDRFGAQEQLYALGRVLGVPALAVESPEGLPGTLATLRERRLVLVDTPGINPRSDRIGRELAVLAGMEPGIEVALVLAASAQAGALEEAIAGFMPLRPAHCVLTRVDEATSLGGAVSAVARSGLPVTWLGTGPRVPEDLEPARAHQLVARAVKAARKSGATADEDLLARRFGGSLNVAA